jgi:hypothetical protein
MAGYEMDVPEYPHRMTYRVVGGFHLPYDVSKTPEEKKSSPQRLEQLILAGEQASITFRVLPVDIQQLYVKQFAMLLAEIEKLRLKLPKEKV